MTLPYSSGLLRRHLLPSGVARLRACSLAIISLVVWGLSGCALKPVADAVPLQAAVHLTGRVHGGQQPVSGALMQLYAAGTAGNGSAATPLLTATVVTDAGGGFNITGDYSCPTPGTQVYLTATGGNPGLPAGTVNPAISLMVALGDCAVVQQTAQVSVNELTTAAAAWALAPFATSASQVGSSVGNAAGLRNAMATATMLADSNLGIAPALQLPGNAQTETAKLITLANLLAGCVNSDGTVPCQNLFGDLFGGTGSGVGGGAGVADTFSAALAIVQHPGYNVATLFADTPAQAAFPGGLSAAPSDWSMSIGYTGGGLASPASLAVDGQGSVWVTDTAGGLSSFSSQGVPADSAAYTGGGLNVSGALAADAQGNVWVANPQPGAGSVVEFSSTGAVMSGPSGYTGSGIDQPAALAMDASGNTWVASGAGVLTVLNPSGVPVSGAGGWGAGALSLPTAIAIDAAGAAWVTSGNTPMLTRIDYQGNLANQIACCANATLLALDAAGFAWTGSPSSNLLTRVSPSGVIESTSIGGGGLNAPQAFAVDGRDRVWVANGLGNSVSQFGGSDAPDLPGTALSPVSGLGLDAALNLPTGLGVDASGNLWVSSFGDNRLVKFVGLAVPVRTPRVALPAAP